jgi:hypothetical protein
MKRNVRKAITELVRTRKRRDGGYEWRGQTYKTKTQLKAAVTAAMENEAAENKKLQRRRPMKPLRISADTIKDMREERAEREARRRDSLADWGWRETWYIAVCKYGFGVDNEAWKAIRLAQESVPLSAKPAQMAIYRSDTEIEPTGFVTWPNGSHPSLVGLTNTHAGWQKRPR